MISHAEAQALTSARLDGPLDPVAERELVSHLATCSSCRSFAEQSNALATGLQRLPFLPASPTVSRAVHAYISKPRSPLAKLNNLVTFQAMPAFSAMAAALIVVALGVFIYMRVDKAGTPLDPGNDQPQQSEIGNIIDAPSETVIIATTETPPGNVEGIAGTKTPESEPTTPPEQTADSNSTSDPAENSTNTSESEPDSTNTSVPPDAPTSTAVTEDGPTSTSESLLIDGAGDQDSTESAETPIPTLTESGTEPEQTPDDVTVETFDTQLAPSETPADVSVPPTETPDVAVPTETPATSGRKINPSATTEPTVVPTETAEPTAEPTETPEPTVVPTETPEPTAVPTETSEPTVVPTETSEPTAVPTETSDPTVVATETSEPTAVPTETSEPTAESTETPEPTLEPTETFEPTAEPTETSEPTAEPTLEPTAEPTLEPTETTEPTATETAVPTETPLPTTTETLEPTATEVVEPTATESDESPPIEPSNGTVEPSEEEGVTPATKDETPDTEISGFEPIETPEPTETELLIEAPTDTPVDGEIIQIDDATAEPTEEIIDGGDNQNVDPTEEVDTGDDGQAEETPESEEETTPDDIGGAGDPEIPVDSSGTEGTALSDVSVEGQFDGIGGDPNARLALDSDSNVILDADPDSLSTVRSDGAYLEQTEGTAGVYILVCNQNGDCVSSEELDAERDADRDGAVLNTPIGWFGSSVIYERIVGDTVTFRAFDVDPDSLSLSGDQELVSGGREIESTQNGAFFGSGGVLLPGVDHWVYLSLNGDSQILGGNPFNEIAMVRTGHANGQITYIGDGNLVVADRSDPGNPISIIGVYPVDYDLSPGGDLLVISIGDAIQILDLDGNVLTSFVSADGTQLGSVLWLNQGIAYVDLNTGSIRLIPTENLP